MKVVLVRHGFFLTQTLGRLYFYDENHVLFLELCTLELPWNDNIKNLSCIPAGSYNCVPRFSKRFGNHFEVKNVPNRDLILFHAGNFSFQTKGCILLGTDFLHLDKNDTIVLSYSLYALNTLIKFLPNGFSFEIIEL